MAKRVLTQAEIAAQLKKWRPLAVSRAWSFRKRLRAGHDVEDMVSIAMTALWQAIITYEDDRGAKFGTYASRVVTYALIGEVKRMQTSNRRVAYRCRQSLDAEHANGKPVYAPASPLPDPEASLVRKQSDETMASACAALPGRLREVLHLHYERDQMFAEIGERFGVSRQRVKQLEQKAIKRLAQAAAVAP